MTNTTFGKKRIQFSKLSSLVSLDCFYLSVKETLNMDLKFLKHSDNIRFSNNRVKPNKFTEVINKTNVVLISIN